MAFISSERTYLRLNYHKIMKMYCLSTNYVLKCLLVVLSGLVKLDVSIKLFMNVSKNEHVLYKFWPIIFYRPTFMTNTLCVREHVYDTSRFMWTCLAFSKFVTFFYLSIPVSNTTYRYYPWGVSDHIVWEHWAPDFLRNHTHFHRSSHHLVKGELSGLTNSFEFGSTTLFGILLIS